MEVDFSCVDQNSDGSQCKLIFAVEPNEDCGAMMDVRFIYVHLPQSIKEDDVCGGAIVNKNPF